MNTRSVLCVDDDAGVREFYAVMLQAYGYRALLAEDSLKALQKFSVDDVDLVLTDYAMPGMNGAELAAEIKRRSPHTPILMISASRVRGSPAGKRKSSEW